MRLKPALRTRRAENTMPERYRREIRFWGRSPDRDADDELRFHIEMRTAELVERGWRRGRCARRGGPRLRQSPAVKAEVRAHRSADRRATCAGRRWLADLRQDVVAGLRQFRKAPGFTAAAVLTIALGIGATTAIFGVVHAVVLRPLPFAEPERIAFVTEFWRDQRSDVSVGNFVDWRAASTDVFSHLAAINYTNLNVADGSEPERVLAGQVSRGFFELFGMAPLHGRVLRADEDSPGRDGVVVLSHGFFVQRFAADPSVVGRTIRLNERPHVVVGVMPEAFDYLADNGALWVPIAFTPEQEAEHDEHYLTVFGRLAPGVTWAQAEDRLVAVAARSREAVPQGQRRHQRSRDVRTPTGWSRMCGCACSPGWAPSPACCSSRAPTSPTSCWPAARAARASWPCAPRSARAGGGSSASCWPKASCSRPPAPSAAWRSPVGRRSCSPCPGPSRCRASSRRVSTARCWRLPWRSPWPAR